MTDKFRQKSPLIVRKPFMYKEWNHMIDRIYESSGKTRLRAQRDNEEVAKELSDFNFTPRINKVSRQLTQNRSDKSFLERARALERQKEERLARIRNDKEQAVVAECTFSPTNIAGTESARILHRTGHLSLTNERDRQVASEEKTRREAARKRIVDAALARDLTFSPSLNAQSREIRGRLERDKAILVDPVTRQTVAIARPASAGMAHTRRAIAAASDSGGRGGNNSSVDREGMRDRGSPSSVLRATRARGAESDGLDKGTTKTRKGGSDIVSIALARRTHSHSPGRCVSDRLYEAGMKKLIETHNTQAQLLVKHFRMRLRHWETSRVPGQRRGDLTQSHQSAHVSGALGTGQNFSATFNSIGPSFAPQSSPYRLKEKLQQHVPLVRRRVSSPVDLAEGDEREPLPVAVIATDDLALDDDPLFGVRLWKDILRIDAAPVAFSPQSLPHRTQPYSHSPPPLSRRESFASVEFGVRGSAVYDSVNIECGDCSRGSSGDYAESTGYVEGYENYTASLSDGAVGSDLVTEVLGKELTLINSA